MTVHTLKPTLGSLNPKQRRVLSLWGKVEDSAFRGATICRLQGRGHTCHTQPIFVQLSFQKKAIVAWETDSRRFEPEANGGAECG